MDEFENELGGLYSSDEHKENITSLYITYGKILKDRGYVWRLRSRVFGCRRGVQILDFIEGLLIVGKRLTPYGIFRMNRDICPLHVFQGAFFQGFKHSNKIFYGGVVSREEILLRSNGMPSLFLKNWEAGELKNLMIFPQLWQGSMVGNWSLLTACG